MPFSFAPVMFCFFSLSEIAPPTAPSATRFDPMESRVDSVPIRIRFFLLRFGSFFRQGSPLLLLLPFLLSNLSDILFPPTHTAPPFVLMEG